jgi:hypothetical protein
MNRLGHSVRDLTTSQQLAEFGTEGSCGMARPSNPVLTSGLADINFASLNQWMHPALHSAAGAVYGII